MDLILIFKLYGCLISSFLLIYIVTSIFLDSKKNSTFNIMLVGVVIFPTIYAVIVSRGVSVLSILLIITLISFLFYRKVKIRIRFSNINPKPIIIGIVFLTGIYIIHLFYFYNFIEGINYIIKSDYEYYSRLASYLRDTGIENINIELFLSESKSVVPYHYIEMWFTAFVSDFFKIHSQYALMLIVIPILYSVIFFGGVDIIRIIKNKLGIKKNIIDYLIGLFILITSTAGFLYPNYIPFLKSDVWSMQVHGYHKLIYVYAIFIAILINFLKKDYKLVSLLVSILIVCQVNVAPAILVSYTLFFVYQLKLRRISMKSFIENISLPMITLVLFGLFYKIYGGQDNVSLEKSEIINQFNNFSNIRIAINIIGKTFIQILIISLPFFILFFYYRKRLKKYIEKDFFYFLIFLNIGSLLSWVLFNQMHDSVQLWGNLFLVFSNITVFTLSFLVYYSSKNNLTKAIVVLLILIVSIVNYSKNKDVKTKVLHTKQDVKSVFAKKDFKVVFIKEKEDYTSYFLKHEQTWVGQNSSLMRTFDPLLITCISNYNIPIIDFKDEKFNQNTTFIKYISKLKEDSLFLGYLDAQVKFIKDYKINYVMVNHFGSLPENISYEFKNKVLGDIDGYRVYEIFVY